MRIGKRDLIWSYAAQLLSVASGVIVLPIILRCLSEQEVGFNYILLSVGGIITLINFGFTPQFSRSVTFVYSGCRSLLKEGVEPAGSVNVSDIDYHLLKKVIVTARWIYLLFGLIALVLLCTVGTMYIYHVTQGFQAVPHAVEIWMLYSISVALSLYVDNYGVLLFGSGQLVKRYQVAVITQVFVIVLSYVVLYLGFGLLGRVAVLLGAVFVQYALSHIFYFTRELKRKIAPYTIRWQEKQELFAVLWFNAKRGGLCKLSEMFTSQGIVMVAGAFLTLGEVASFGLMQQLFLIAGNVSNISLQSYQPQLSYWLAKGQNKDVVSKMAWGMQIFYGIFGLASLAIVFMATPVLEWIGSNSQLPALWIMVAYAILRGLELNYQNYNLYYIASNRYPFVKSVVFTGMGVVLGAYIFTAIIPLGTWGLVIAIGVCQLSWMDWYWPRRVLLDMGVTLKQFISLGLQEIRRSLKPIYG